MLPYALLSGFLRKSTKSLGDRRLLVGRTRSGGSLGLRYDTRFRSFGVSEYTIITNQKFQPYSIDGHSLYYSISDPDPFFPLLLAYPRIYPLISVTMMQEPAFECGSSVTPIGTKKAVRSPFTHIFSFSLILTSHSATGAELERLDIGIESRLPNVGQSILTATGTL